MAAWAYSAWFSCLHAVARSAEREYYAAKKIASRRWRMLPQHLKTTVLPGSPMVNLNHLGRDLMAAVPFLMTMSWTKRRRMTAVTAVGVAAKSAWIR